MAHHKYFFWIAQYWKHLTYTVVSYWCHVCAREARLARKAGRDSTASQTPRACPARLATLAKDISRFTFPVLRLLGPLSLASCPVPLTFPIFIPGSTTSRARHACPARLAILAKDVSRLRSEATNSSSYTRLGSVTNPVPVMRAAALSLTRG